MKQFITIQLLLFVVLIICIILCVSEFQVVQNYLTSLDVIKDAEYVDDFRKIYKQQLVKHSIFAGLSIIAIITVLITMLLIALKDLAIFKPLIEKHQAKVNNRKASKAKSKADRAEANKQARIEKLQAELESLKTEEH